MADHEPQTEAGRALLEREAYNSRSFALITADAILAIEAQATAAARAEVGRKVRGLPDHERDGYECEWSCLARFGSDFPDCQPDNPDHQHELISRAAVLAIVEPIP